MTQNNLHPFALTKKGLLNNLELVNSQIANDIATLPVNDPFQFMGEREGDVIAEVPATPTPTPTPIPISIPNTTIIGETHEIVAITTNATAEEGGATTEAFDDSENGGNPKATTEALGEEGGTSEPTPTTLAIGEEGGNDPVPTTLALGEEGGITPMGIPPGTPNIPPGEFTTLALGEEGGDFTTLALGEEGGISEATTRAVGEEGGVTPIGIPPGTPNIPPGEFTTLAIGEEGGDFTTLAVGEEGGDVVTTEALGEEGGFPTLTEDSILTQIGTEEGIGIVTTQAIGEEGGDIFTTLAVGEEGGNVVTTDALGEEGGLAIVTEDGILTEVGTEEGIVTTQAIGEEGGTPTPFVDGDITQPGMEAGVVTTQATGEEGADFNEEIYRQTYPEVNVAINIGEFNSAFQHYVEFGQFEIERIGFFTGTDGNDIITAFGNNTRIVGVNTLGYDVVNDQIIPNSFGAGEIDVLIGSSGENIADKFILGSAEGVPFYVGFDNLDFAVIQNFDINFDQIQLPGNLNDYNIEIVNNSANISTMSGDLIAIVENVSSLDTLGINFI